MYVNRPGGFTVPKNVSRGRIEEAPRFVKEGETFLGTDEPWGVAPPF